MKNNHRNNSEAWFRNTHKRAFTYPHNSSSFVFGFSVSSVYSVVKQLHPQIGEAVPDVLAGVGAGLDFAAQRL